MAAVITAGVAAGGNTLFFKGVGQGPQAENQIFY
jgi:hypothetical protein